MEIFTIFMLLGLIIVIGFFGEIVFKKTNIPDVIWLIMIGIIIGSVLKLVAADDFGTFAPIFSTFALIFILFEGALSIDIVQLIKEMMSGAMLTLLNFLFSVIAVTIITLLMGWPILYGVLLGSILGGISSAVVLPITRNLNIKENTKLILTIESAVSDVLCIVGAITVIEIISLNTFNLREILNNIAGSFAIALLIGLAAGIIWLGVLRKMQFLTHAYMMTVAMLLVLFGFVEYIQSNGAIAALAFGLILGNSKRIFTLTKTKALDPMGISARTFYSEISFFVKTFFFVYLGILLTFNNPLLMVWGLFITLVLFLVRPLAVMITVRNSKVSDKDRAVLESLIPKGLAAAVLAQLPLQYNIANAAQFSTIVLSVIFFSIITCTILVFLIEKDYFKGLGSLYHKF